MAAIDRVAIKRGSSVHFFFFSFNSYKHFDAIKFCGYLLK